jgi:hypothetical protein
VSSTETTPPPERKVSLADELDFWKRDHAQNLSEHDAAQKRRPKHEAILVITCLLAVSYTYPVETFDKNPVIEISAISLKIPLRDAIAVFPTIIATLYLIFLSAVIREINALTHLEHSTLILQHFRETREFTGKLNGYEWSPRHLAVNYLFLPSPLHSHPWGVYSTFAVMSRAIVEFFVGFVFTALPYVAAGYITYRSWLIIGNRWILGWNIVCMAAMVLSFSSAFISSSMLWFLRRGGR